MKGKLTLVPTPIDETTVLGPVAKELLLKSIEDNNALFVVEEIKAGRRRWIRFGLPREIIPGLILLNEHNTDEMTPSLIKELKTGKNVYLMSDGGLPAFMDPGKDLVRSCHENKIKVTATPFCNSISLAMALSGINHNSFRFIGFLPRKKEERILKVKQLAKIKETIVLMDTPYRLKATLEDLKPLGRIIFLGMDLNCENETLFLGPPAEALRSIKDFKREFILIIE